MDKRTQIVKSLMHEAKLSDYQKFVKEELKDMDHVEFEDRGKMMKDIAKKWKAKKGSILLNPASMAQLIKTQTKN